VSVIRLLTSRPAARISGILRYSRPGKNFGHLLNPGLQQMSNESQDRSDVPLPDGSCGWSGRWEISTTGISDRSPGKFEGSVEIQGPSACWGEVMA